MKQHMFVLILITYYFEIENKWFNTHAFERVKIYLFIMKYIGILENEW